MNEFTAVIFTRLFLLLLLCCCFRYRWDIPFERWWWWSPFTRPTPSTADVGVPLVPTHIHTNEAHRARQEAAYIIRRGNAVTAGAGWWCGAHWDWVYKNILQHTSLWNNPVTEICGCRYSPPIKVSVWHIDKEQHTEQWSDESKRR